MKIVIGADFVPTISNIKEFSAGNLKSIIDNRIINYLKDADYRIVNLEMPFADAETPIKKWGENLRASCVAVNGYKELQINLVTLANNHIFDQGQVGLESTIRTLDTNGIQYVGAGLNKESIRDTIVINVKGKKIGVYACAEHEYSIADGLHGGANAFDALCSFEAVKELKNICDYVIVLYHGGKEYYRYPSPDLNRNCKRFVEVGADLIICQHSHCIGCIEKYQSGSIIYGQGNFLFDDGDNEFVNTGLLVSINDNFELSFTPIKRNGKGITICSSEEATKILEDFYQRGNSLEDSAFMENTYKGFADSWYAPYISLLTGMRNKIIYRVLNRISNRKFEKWYISHIYHEKELLAIKNCIQCEAHRELLLQAIDNRLHESR